jgi:hypothetical protein
MCPSSGEITLSMRHLVFFTIWITGMHTIQSSTQSDKYQVSHRYSYFSGLWAHSCPIHVEKINKHTEKNCAPIWLHSQDYTRKHGQQNVKFYVNNYPTRCDCIRFIYCCKLFYTFRTATLPVIRSTYNCIHSIWH